MPKKIKRAIKTLIEKKKQKIQKNKEAAAGYEYKIVLGHPVKVKKVVQPEANLEEPREELKTETEEKEES